jgi:hypothetical protein
MSDPFMPKHRHTVRPAGYVQCSYTPTGDAALDCGRPATWHVLWDREMQTSLSCDEHMRLIEARWVFDDRHRVGSDCNMPGALWRFNAGRCEVPGSDGAFAAATVPEPCGIAQQLEATFARPAGKQDPR